MNTRFLMSLGGLLLTFLSFGQNDTISISDTVSYNHLFSEIEPLSFTGIFPEMAATTLPWEKLTGTTGGEVEVLKPKLFSQLLLDLDLANIGQRYTSYRKAMSNFDDSIASQSQVPIVILDIQYDKFRSDDSTLLHYDTLDECIALTDTLKDSIFFAETLFAASVPDSFLYNGLNLTFDQSHFYSNSASLPASFQVSINLGQSWIAKNWNEEINLSSSSNEEIWIKALYHGGVQKLAKFQIPQLDCGEVSVPTPSLAPWNSDPNQFRYGNIVANVTNQPGGPAVGNAYTWFRPSPVQGNENLYKKPIIIVEGIDFGKYNQNNSANYRMGTFGWCDLWGGNPKYPLQKMPALLNNLHNEEYDIVMLDFKDGDYYIQENAYLLAALIKEINDYRADDSEPIVVMGASMGGVVSRYALRWMEQNDKNHCARLFLSLDAPHKGAYVPLGLQRFVHFYANNDWNKSSSAKEFEKNLKSPAASQLLLMDNSGRPHPRHTAFYNELDQMGYPENTKNIGITSGSKSGITQSFSTGQKLFDMSGSWSYYPVQINTNAKIYALEDYQTGTVFEGQLNVNFTIPQWIVGPWFNVSLNATQTTGPANTAHPSYDRLAGGQRAYMLELKWSGLPSFVTANVFKENQCFIPMISALDIQSTNWYYDAINLDNFNPDPSITPFDAIYGPGDNTFHVEITDGVTSGKGDNIEFTYKYVSEGGTTNSGSYSLLTSTYNYGLKSRDHVLHKNVGSGGKLLLYGNVNDGDGQGQTGPPVSGQERDYYLGNSCTEAQLSIADGGLIVIGESSVGNKANFHISSGSSLTIEGGGKLRVEDGSKLIIEDGGQLIYDANAEIDLSGNLSELIIQGKLVVTDNAILTYSGDGRIIFDQQVRQPNGTLAFGDYMDIGVNCTFQLSGPAGTPPYTQKLIEVRKPVYFLDENDNTFNAVDFRYGQIEMTSGALLYLYGKSEFHSITVSKIGSGPRHGGIRIWNDGSHGAIFNDCDFRDGSFGLRADWIGGGPAIEVRNCRFEDNTSALVVIGGNFEVLNSQFTDNNLSIQGSALSGTSMLSASNIVAGATGVNGITLNGQTGAFVNINQVEVKDYLNSGSGLDLFGIDATITCSKILSNTVGLDLWNSIAYLDNQSGNQFINNTIGIQYGGNSSETGIFLANGENKFGLGTNGSWYISGVTQGGGLISNYHSASKVDADLNEMPPKYSSATGWVIPVRLGIDFVTNSLGLYIPNNFQNNTSCSNSVSTAENPFLTAINTETGVGGDIPLSGASFKSELKDAIGYITFSDNEMDDSTAFMLLMDLLEANVTDRDSSYEALRYMAIGASMNALENRFQFGSLENAGGGALFPMCKDLLIY